MTDVLVPGEGELETLYEIKRATGEREYHRVLDGVDSVISLEEFLERGGVTAEAAAELEERAS